MTVTGVDEDVVVPLPSCPLLFRPQHVAVPPDNKAHEWPWPAVTAMAVVIPVTVTGVDESV